MPWDHTIIGKIFISVIFLGPNVKLRGSPERGTDAMYLEANDNGTIFNCAPLLSLSNAWFCYLMSHSAFEVVAAKYTGQKWVLQKKTHPLSPRWGISGWGANCSSADFELELID